MNTIKNQYFSLIFFTDKTNKMKLTNRVKGTMLRLNEGTEPLILHDEDNECTHYQCGCNIAENDNEEVIYYICSKHLAEEKLMKNFFTDSYDSFFGKPIVQAAIITAFMWLLFFTKILIP